MATSISTIATVKEFNTSVEDAIVFVRENGETVNFALQHFADVREFDLAIIPNAEDGEARDRVTLSLAETRMLRALLLKPEVSGLLDAAE